MTYQKLIETLGYSGSPNFREDAAGDLLPPSDRHWHRVAISSGVRGSYFFRTSPALPEAKATMRVAVHVAQAADENEARLIHRRLWNQGMSPFLIVVLPGQIRVYTGFAYDPRNPRVGEVVPSINAVDVGVIGTALAAFQSEAIDRGEIWQAFSAHLGVAQRVDTTLLEQLRVLSGRLQEEYRLSDRVAHSLIGKFVYLSYLRARGIISDPWLRDYAKLEPNMLFGEDGFSSSLTLTAFRQLVRAVERRFNGKLFPIPWGGPSRPDAASVRMVARVFSGEDAVSQQMHLSFAAYDFSSIPVEFLSSIYEQFLHAKPVVADESSSEADEEETENEAADPEKGGAHYTPEPLADYLVSEVQSVRALRPGMRVLDPCCGSGVFLVVAYRRLVELVCAREGRESLPADELSRLLQASIFAVELNRSACDIASFSLVLTLLSYVKPPELHRLPKFKFPSLVGQNVFHGDFFDDRSPFWQRVAGADGRSPLRFDWILGNPPWVELEENLGNKAAHLRRWSQAHEHLQIPRKRTGEAFAWRAMECVTDDGAVGLVLHAKTLTNDQLAKWRRKFFSEVRVHRVTNFSNFAYVLFASAQPPAFTIVYSKRASGEAGDSGNILHLGPFVFNQRALQQEPGAGRKSWVLGFTESEIKQVPQAAAQSGAAAVWKQALWATSADQRAIERLKRVFPRKLGELAKTRGWNLALGLQLRNNEGTDRDPAEYRKELEGLPVIDHRAFARIGKRIAVPEGLILENRFGCFVRERGGLAGLIVVNGPHLLLVSDFAAFSTKSFIIRHSKMGLSGGDAREMKAVAAVWNSHFTSYLLFFVLSSEWGIDRSLIDKGDAVNLPFPELTPEREKALAEVWDKAAAMEADGADFETVKSALTTGVAAVLRVPASLTLVVREFFEVRYRLNKSRSPRELRLEPKPEHLEVYARRLRDALDDFLGGKGRHRLRVLHGSAGVAVSITISRHKTAPYEIDLRPAVGTDQEKLRLLLTAAEERFSQWAYVRKSVRVFDGDTIHLIKPPRRLEWTATQALLDADDLIAEVVANQSTAAV